MPRNSSFPLPVTNHSPAGKIQHILQQMEGLQVFQGGFPFTYKNQKLKSPTNPLGAKQATRSVDLFLFKEACSYRANYFSFCLKHEKSAGDLRVLLMKSPGSVSSLWFGNMMSSPPLSPRSKHFAEDH